MQVKIASGSAGTAISIIGTGLTMLVPGQRWIGILLIGIGLLVFLFDVRVDHGHLEFGDHRLGGLLPLGSRATAYKIIALVCIGSLGFLILYFWPPYHDILPLGNNLSPYPGNA